MDSKERLSYARNILVNITVLILGSILIYWLILKLTNHSPATTAVLSAGASVFAALVINNTKNVAVLKSEMKQVKQDMKEVKQELKKNQRMIMKVLYLMKN